MLGLVLAFSDFAVGSVFAEEAGGAFASALHELQEKRAQAGPVVKTTDWIEWNDTFLRRIDPATLKMPEMAAAVRMNVFSRGDNGRALAKKLFERAAPLAEHPDAEGALAAIICANLAGPAGFDGKERQKWRTCTLRHPGLDSLLLGEFGDLALDTARGAGGDGEDLDRVLALAEKLDASKSTAAAPIVRYYWTRRVDKLTNGEQRETIRRQLVDYLTAALEKERGKPGDPENIQRIEESLTYLNGPAAPQSELIGGPAPNIHFIWSSRNDIKSLSDLRGKVVMLDFWATWCGPCVASFPKVSELAEHYRGFDVEVVGVTSLQGFVLGLEGKGSIDCRNDPEKELRLLEQYIGEKAFTWPMVVSKEPVYNLDYGVDGIPTAVIIAPDGTVRAKFAGFSKPKVIAEIDALLAEFKRPVPAPLPEQESSP